LYIRSPTGGRVEGAVRVTVTKPGGFMSRWPPWLRRALVLAAVSAVAESALVKNSPHNQH